MTKALFLTASLLTAAAANGVHAQDSLANASQASGESLVSTARLSEAGVKVVAGAVALPFVAAGAVIEGSGRVVRDSAGAVWDEANGPLEISPETVVAQPAPQVPYDAGRRRDNTGQ
ncbi:hypothetical protein [Asticcacaulis benevestitus]|uniref:Uncharacterized protein n=1 Tax=Asticcacaulis benevestitus DSM 16100 = ATCC BAA-896 TaxID=1121022 RepID=V4PBT2_9CAUL|nr:hypothetical protein [Asticcacaulis benevestitus]ESQ91377.1 hypothetical protein ABENE_10205 [Asticcacaulis benevestitus DSM 16100 = ATCC BAA-896]